MVMLFFIKILNADGSRDRSTTNDYSEAQRVIAGSLLQIGLLVLPIILIIKISIFLSLSKENLGQVSTMLVFINLQMQTGLITKRLTK
jgi:Na+/H+ antiporter NhaC